MEVLTSQQMIAAIKRGLVCTCGFKPDHRHCTVTRDEDGFVTRIAFTCPMCGSVWEATRAAIN